MKLSTAAVATLVSLVPSIAALTVNTPTNVVQCQPIQFTWSDGTAPYFFSIIPGGQPTAPAVKSFPTQSGKSLTWKVDVGFGTSLTLSLKDSQGTQAYSDIFTVLNSTDTSCISPTVQVSGTPGSASETGGSTTPASTGSTPTGSRTSSSTGTGTSASSTATRTNAASKSAAGVYGFAGVVALAGAAVLL